MSVQVVCRCGSRFLAEDRLLGKQVPCPECGAALPIPAPSAVKAAGSRARSGDAATVVVCRCGGRFQARSDLIGKTVRCPQCGGALRIADSRATSAPRSMSGGNFADPLGLDAAASPAYAGLPKRTQGRGLAIPEGARLALKIALGVAGALSAIAVCFLIVRLLWTAAGSIRDVVEPEWVADSSVVESFRMAEVGSYAMRVPRMLARNSSGTLPGDIEIAEHTWIGSADDSRLGILLITSPDHVTRNSLRQHAEDLMQRNLALTERQLQGKPVWERGRIGGLSFLRLSYACNGRGSFVTYGHLCGAYNRIWVADDGPIRIVIQFISSKPFDGQAFALMENAVRTWLRSAESEASESGVYAQCKGWTPDPTLQLDAGSATILPVPPGLRNSGTILLEDVAAPRSIPMGSHSDVLYAPYLAPYVVAGQAVYRLTDGTRLGACPTRSLSYSAISTDGALFAAVQGDSIRVYSVATGAVIREWKARANVRFLDASRLILFSSRETQIIQATTGQVESRLPVRGSAVSPDGRFLISATRDDLHLWNLATGESLGRLQRPPSGQAQAFASLAGLAFSPDMQEVAAIVPENRVVCWSHRGELVLDYPMPRHWRQHGNRSDKLRWIPDRRGWLLMDQYFLDRPTQRVTVVLRPSLTVDTPYRFLDNCHLLVPRRIDHVGRELELIALPIPWNQIDASLRAMQAGDGFLCPGKPVSISVDVGEIRFAAAEQVRSQLGQAIASAFSANGIPVAEGQPIQLRAVYREAQGEVVQYSEGHPLLPSARYSQGASSAARETVGTLELSLNVQEQSRPVWELKLTKGASYTLSGSATEERIRTGMFETILNEIAQADLPYFVPEKPEHVALPLRFDLRTPAERRVAR
jgi:hypothetical protein